MTLLTAAPRAVILAAGLGSRLRPLTNERPKPLIEVHGTPILHNALWHLADAGVREVTLVVGYQKEVIERACGREFAGIHLTYTESDAFDRTGSAYSLWLARETLLHGGTLLFEGDVFFEPAILTRLLASKHRDVGAVAPFTQIMSGSAVTLVEGGLIDRVHMNQSADSSNGTPLFKTLNLYRFEAETLKRTLVPALDAWINSGNTRSYVEQVLASLIEQRRLELAAVDCGDLNWFEIDNEADLRTAEAIFAPVECRATDNTFA